MYRLEYDTTNILKRDKQKLLKDLWIAKKIKLNLENLSINPFSKLLNIKKLEPKSASKFRLRVDNYRVIYSMDFWNKIILIHRIWLRKDIYKN